VAHLRWSEIDFDLLEIRVIAKREKPHCIPMSPMVMAIIRNQIGNHSIQVFTFVAVRTVRSNPKNGQAYVKGRRYPLNYYTFGTMWERFRRKARVDGLRIHDLRHTFGSRFLREVKDLRVAQQALGHSNVKETSRYAHVLQDQVATGMAAAEHTKADFGSV
jgi:integrase